MADERLPKNAMDKFFMCDRKQGYPTQSKANKSARRRGWEYYRAYECPVCWMWHLTKNNVP